MLEQVGGQVQAGRLRLHQRQRGLCALFHHVAELAGQDQASAAGDAHGLDEQDVAAHRRPSQARGHPRLAAAQRDLVFGCCRAQQRFQRVLFDPHLGRRAFCDLQCDAAHHAADLALELAHTGLAGVGRGDRAQCGLADLALLFAQTVVLALASHQVAACDLQFFLQCVAGQVDHLHAVAYRCRDVVDDVGGGDEQDPAEVEGQAEVVVAEARVLLRVQHLEQRRRGVAAQAGGHLVNLVEHHHRIARASLAQALHDVAWHRADVGAAVAADLGFVVYAAQRHPNERSADRPRDALAQRGLAHAWRADEAQDRCPTLWVELLDGEKLDDAALDAV